MSILTDYKLFFQTSSKLSTYRALHEIDSTKFITLKQQKKAFLKNLFIPTPETRKQIIQWVQVQNLK
jgi:hypothetical protein